MQKLSNAAHRLYLKIFQGRAAWHQRFYRPSVSVVEGSERIWFKEGGITIAAYPLSVLKGEFAGRCNLLLSGPSVKGIEDISLLVDADLIGVNGSPGLFGEKTPKMKFYHVNDTTFIRSSVDRFIEYASHATYTVIDYRSMYWLLENASHRLSRIRFAVYDSWAYPLRLPLGEIQNLSNPAECRGVYFSHDLNLGLAVGGTVAYTAAQIAWHGGFDALYIYGLDLSNIGRFYEEDTVQPQMLDKAFDTMIQPSFELLVRETAPSGFKVFNCNPKSRLPASVLPYLNVNESLTHTF